MTVVPDTVDQLLGLVDADRGADATFWALTDDQEIVCCEQFKIWHSEGHVLAHVFSAGLATQWRVACEAINLDYTAPWDDGIPVPAKPGDGIRFHFMLNWQMLVP